MAKKKIKRVDLRNIDTLQDVRTLKEGGMYLRVLHSNTYKPKHISNDSQIERAKMLYQQENKLRISNYMRSKHKWKNYRKPYISPEMAKITKLRIYKIKD